MTVDVDVIPDLHILRYDMYFLSSVRARYSIFRDVTLVSVARARALMTIVDRRLAAVVVLSTMAAISGQQHSLFSGIFSPQRQGAMVFRTSLIILSLLVGWTSAEEGTCSAGDAVCSAQATTTTPPRPRQCTLYMAESTIPHAGLGIFTGVPRVPGETLGSGDVLIPVTDLWYHLDADASEEHLDPTADYIWHGPEMGMQQETSHPNQHISAFAPGLDAAINCHLGLINVDKGVPDFDTGGLHRSRDPGAGAITPYHNCTTKVIRDMPAGSEAMKDYGDNWFETRPYAFATLPLKGDYPKADTLNRHVYNLVTNIDASDELLTDLWDIITDPNLESRLLNALPRDAVDVERVASEGIRNYYQPSGIRSLEELDRTGRCLDIVRPGKSTIPQAGRGLFATQLLPEGSLVAGTPLLQVQDQRVFEMYQGDWYDKEEEPDRDHLEGFQIMMNYCWKHWESRIYLCPYGAGVNYINHNTQGEPNVRVQWAEDGVMGHKAEWLMQGPEEMGFHASPGLFMDLVATRDIQPGDEIFLDYGDEWVAAWDDHVEAWEDKEYHHSPDYQSARDWNKENGQVMLRTSKEQEEEPYPSHMELRCLAAIEDVEALTNADAARQWITSESGILCDIALRRKPIEEDAHLGENEYVYRVKFAPLVYSPETEYFEQSDDWVRYGTLSFFVAELVSY